MNFEKIDWRKPQYHHLCTPRAAEAAVYGDAVEFVYILRRGQAMVMPDTWYVALAEEAEGKSLKEAENSGLYFKRLELYKFSTPGSPFLKRRGEAARIEKGD